MHNFTKETLAFSQDLTKFLEDNPMGFSSGMRDLLIAYPKTNTRVGQMPASWNVNKSDSEKIFALTEEFANDFEINTYQATNPEYKQSLIEKYKTDLADILKVYSPNLS